MLQLAPEIAAIVQRHAPILMFHPEEKFFPCTSEFYVQRSQLGERQGKDQPPRIVLKSQDTTEENLTSKCGGAPNQAYFLDLVNDSDRAGMIDSALSDIPIYCHLKLVPVGNTEIMEINYIFLYTYSGPYEVLGNRAGAHEGDWEHLTVRCDPNSGDLIAVYYSAHRHGDGKWILPRDLPVDASTGRIVAYVSHNGHGVHPTTGSQLRVFGFANDVTSGLGRRWGSKQVIVAVAPGQPPGTVISKASLPIVEDRKNKHLKPYNGPSDLLNLLPPMVRRDDAPTPVQDIEVLAMEKPFLLWGIKWGKASAPQLQKWFRSAEHPTGSTTTKRYCLPCMKV